MIRSAVLITSRLCSITITVFPASTSRPSTSSSRWTSAKCKPGGGLVEDVEGVAGGDLGELGGELHPLGLAAGELGGRLAEPDVVEPDVVEGVEAPGDLRDVA